MDIAQSLLLAVVLILTGLLVFLGIQVFFILRELRRTLERANKILDNANSITESIARPISDFSGILDGVKTGMSLLSIFSKKKKHQEEGMDE